MVSIILQRTITYILRSYCWYEIHGINMNETKKKSGYLRLHSSPTTEGDDAFNICKSNNLINHSSTFSKGQRKKYDVQASPARIP